MATSNSDLIEGLILKNDLYKDNTLLLKKGSILSAYVLNKLHNFGVAIPQTQTEKNENISDFLTGIETKKEVLIIQKDKLNSFRTREVLKHAGFTNEVILMLNTTKDFYKHPQLQDISYIFIDYELFSQDFLQETLLLKSRKKVKIFVLNCENAKSKNFIFNNEFQDIKFLHQPLANNYIKALLRLYS